MKQTAILSLLALILAAPMALAQTPERGKLPEKHDSNTLHKLGKAIEYPVRKLGENTSKTTRKGAKATQYSVRKGATNASITAHQATGKNSIAKKKSHRTGRRVKRVITPGGHVRALRPNERG